MAPTFRPGKKAFLKLVRGASTMILSSGVDTGELARLCDTYDVTGWGKDDKNFIAGLRSATLKFSGPWASTYETFLSGGLGSSSLNAFTFGPESTVATRIKLTGNLIFTNYMVQAPVNGRINWTVDCQLTGAITSTKF